ncbi:MAG: hypothetical protein QXY76_07875 [Nitrososphaeria archaeon]
MRGFFRNEEKEICYSAVIEVVAIATVVTSLFVLSSVYYAGVGEAVLIKHKGTAYPIHILQQLLQQLHYTKKVKYYIFHDCRID